MKYETFANSIFIFRRERFSNVFIGGNLTLTLVLGFLPSSSKKRRNNEHQICEIEQKSQSLFLLPRFQ